RRTSSTRNPASPRRGIFGAERDCSAARSPNKYNPYTGPHMIATLPNAPSMNEASEKDPFNNNCYGTTIDRPYKGIHLPVLDVNDFNERIIRGYEEGHGERDLPADLSVARSLVPAGTASLRDVSYLAPEIPKCIPENCTGS